MSTDWVLKMNTARQQFIAIQRIWKHLLFWHNLLCAPKTVREQKAEKVRGGKVEKKKKWKKRNKGQQKLPWDGSVAEAFVTN